MMNANTYTTAIKKRFAMSSTNEVAKPRGVKRRPLQKSVNRSISSIEGASNDAWGTMILAGIASIGIMLLRMQGSMMIGWLWTEFALLAAFGIVFRYRAIACRSHEEASRVVTLRNGMILCTLLVVLAPWISNIIQKRMLGMTGEATELVWLAMLQYAAIWQAATARIARHEWVSFLLSSFLVLFSVATSDRNGMLMVVAPYGICAAWWLMSRYWRSIEDGFVASESVPLIRLRLGMISVALILTGIIAWVTIPNAKDIVMLDGFMPTSGGKKDADPSSRQGVGDGDMLVAARDEAYTFGPVDSELFLDSQSPSMYDLISESFGEPTKRKVQYSRAIALENEVQEAKEEGSESKQKGKEFSAMRQPRDRSTPIKPKGSSSDALMYVLGETPQLLRIESYDTFDGVVWTQSSRETTPQNSHHQPQPSLLDIGGKPWMLVGKFMKDLVYSVRERSTIKIINFQSQRVPSPSLLTHVHIDKVNQEDFFSWMEDGQLMMPNREYIPQLTVLHTMYQVPQLHLLRDATSDKSKLSKDARNTNASMQPGESGRSDWIDHLLEMPNTQTSLAARASDLIRESAGDSTDSLTDWQRIEALVSTMRRQFTLDNGSVPPSECKNVTEYLLETKRGPDYIMSTAAAMMIRSLGIPSRLATGFYVSPRRYDIRSGQTEVMRDDVHTWCEVYVHGTWLPIEVCGEFAIPREYRSWRQWAAESWAALLAEVKNHAIRYVFACVLVVAAFGLRRRLFDATVSTVFLLLNPLPLAFQVRASLYLLRLRRWCWSQGAVEGETVQRWLSRQLGSDSHLSAEQRQLFISAVQRIAYAPREATQAWLENHSRELQKVRWLIGRKGIADMFVSNKRPNTRTQELVVT